MIRTRHLASLAAVVALAFAAGITSVASAQTPLLQLDYNQAKTFGTVEIAGGAIDITSGAMVVNTASFGFVPSQQLPNEYNVNGIGQPEFGDAAIHDAIVKGLNSANGGYWNGTNGIISSSAANDPNLATYVGWLDNGAAGNLIGQPQLYVSWDGQTIGPGQSIIAFTSLGDALLHGTVDLADYNLANGFFGDNTGYLTGGAQPGGLGSAVQGNGGSADWGDGDVLYHGTVDLADYNQVNGFFGSTAPNGPYTFTELALCNRPIGSISGS